MDQRRINISSTSLGARHDAEGSAPSRARTALPWTSLSTFPPRPDAATPCTSAGIGTPRQTATRRAVDQRRIVNGALVVRAYAAARGRARVVLRGFATDRATITILGLLSAYVLGVVNGALLADTASEAHALRLTAARAVAGWDAANQRAHAALEVAETCVELLDGPRPCQCLDAAVVEVRR